MYLFIDTTLRSYRWINSKNDCSMHGKLSENTGCLRPITRQLLAGIAFNDNTVGIEIVFAVAHAAPCQTDTA